jgi:hypothetical protein
VSSAPGSPPDAPSTTAGAVAEALAAFSATKVAELGEPRRGQRLRQQLLGPVGQAQLLEPAQQEHELLP